MTIGGLVVLVVVAFIGGSTGFLFGPRGLRGGWFGTISVAFVGALILGWGYGLIEAAPTVIKVGDIDFMLAFIGAFLAAFLVAPHLKMRV